MGIPLVRNNSVDDINTSIIAIRKQLQEGGGNGTMSNVNVNVKYEVTDTVEDGNSLPVTSQGVYDYIARNVTLASVPVGATLSFYGNTVPETFLFCNGAAFDEQQYPALYAMLGDNHTPVEGHTFDWDNAESITLSTSDYVVQKNGWIVGFGVGQSRGEILINGVVVARYDNTATYNYTADIQIKVKKGDVIKTTSNILSTDQNFHLIPYKYYKVIKATSGIQ